MLSNRPKKTDDFFIEQIDDETLFCHQREGTTIHLNETATLIWRLCDGERSIVEIAELLTEAYPDNANAVRSDVESTLLSLVEKGVVTLDESLI